MFPGVLQTQQKYIGKRRQAIEVEMNLKQSEAYHRPSGARLLVGSNVAPMCKSRYPVHFVAKDVKGESTKVDQHVSAPKCVRLKKKSKKFYEVICKILTAVPEKTKDELGPIVGNKFMG